MMVSVEADTWTGTAIDGEATIRVSQVKGLIRVTVWSDGQEIVRQLTYRTAFEMANALLQFVEDQTTL